MGDVNQRESSGWSEGEANSPQDTRVFLMAPFGISTVVVVTQTHTWINVHGTK